MEDVAAYVRFFFNKTNNACNHGGRTQRRCLKKSACFSTTPRAPRGAGGNAVKTPEFAAEMRLIAVTHFDCDQLQRAAFQQQAASFIHTTLHKIGMRRYADGLLEFAQQMEGTHPGCGGDIVE